MTKRRIALISTGGTIAIDGESPRDLYSGVQGLRVGVDGPSWQPLPVEP